MLSMPQGLATTGMPTRTPLQRGLYPGPFSPVSQRSLQYYYTYDRQRITTELQQENYQLLLKFFFVDTEMIINKDKW